MAASPSNRIERALMMYRDGRYEEAVRFYTEAIGMAKNKAQKIALHSNRAACYLKLHDFKKAAEECTSVLELDHNHIGALMLRAQTLVALKEYHSALFDVNRLLELNPSSEVYQNLQARLKTQLSLAPIPESEEEFEELGDDEEVILIRGDKGEANEKKCAITSYVEGDKKDELGKATINTPFAPFETDANEKKCAITSYVEGDKKDELGKATMNTPFAAFETDAKLSSERERDQVAPKKSAAEEALASKAPNKESSEQHSKGWQSIQKPKGHSALDYARWDSVEDDSSDDDDDDDEEESMPRYQFRVRTIGVRPVK